MKLNLLALAALTLAAPPLASADAAAATPGASCLQDLHDIAPFLLENDTGARQHLAQKGAAYFDLALSRASEAAENTSDASACNVILADYLSKWRTGHLQIVPSAALRHSKPAPPSTPTANTVDKRAPSLQLLSPRTALLTLPSFFPQYGKAIADLLASRRHDLATHPHWIIDVRRNDGGSDSTYAPLLPWISSGEIVSVGGEWLATPANIAGQEGICALYAPGDASCTTDSEHAVARMRSVESGQFVTQRTDGPVSYGSLPKKKTQPARVAVLVDRDCGSSCEQFLLAVRQSFHVKLIGRSSYGALDYSNVRLHALPSGLRQLMYATSRSARLPQVQVDLNGIMPDVYLPPPKDEAERAQEIVRVQRWLEGGTLRPDSM